MPNLPFLQLLTSTGGGWVIYLLFALSVLAVAVIIERTLVINHQARYQNKVLPTLMEKLEDGSPQDLLKTLRPDSILFRLTEELVEHASKGNLSLERHL